MILCGFFCAGKSIVGEKVAQKKGVPFYDIDRLMEADQKKCVSQIWNDLGEEAFRRLEKITVHSLIKQRCVIATGGGTLLREENRIYLKQLGKTIYLKTSISVLWERLQKRGFPAYLNLENPKKHTQQLAKERFPIFEEFCEYIIENQKHSVDSMSELVAAIL